MEEEPKKANVKKNHRDWLLLLITRSCADQAGANLAGLSEKECCQIHEWTSKYTELLSDKNQEKLKILIGLSVLGINDQSPLQALEARLAFFPMYRDWAMWKSGYKKGLILCQDIKDLYEKYEAMVIEEEHLQKKSFGSFHESIDVFQASFEISWATYKEKTKSYFEELGEEKVSHLKSEFPRCFSNDGSKTVQEEIDKERSEIIDLIRRYLRCFNTQLGPHELAKLETDGKKKLKSLRCLQLQGQQNINDDTKEKIKAEIDKVQKDIDRLKKKRKNSTKMRKKFIKYETLKNLHYQSVPSKNVIPYFIASLYEALYKDYDDVSLEILKTIKLTTFSL
jgi:hypothetical protein